ncbi:MAG: hypothetical protein WC205_16745 [Opitutaceae bacterium]|jgi:hypothetical protein
MTDEYTPKQRVYLDALQKAGANCAAQIAFTLQHEYGITLPEKALKHVENTVVIHIPEIAMTVLKNLPSLPNTTVSNTGANTKT